MKKLFEYHNVDRSKALNYVLEKKAKKLQKFLREQDEMRWSFAKVNQQFNIHLEIWKNGKPMNFSKKVHNLFQGVDRMVNAAARVLRERKEKMVAKKHHPSQLSLLQ